MKPAICEIHKAQLFVKTSPHIAKAIEKKQNLKPDDVIKLKIFSSGRLFDYIIDRKFSEGFEISPIGGAIFLLDRDKIKRKLNDRLLIQKIIRKMKWVCPKCLSELVDE